MFVYEKKLEYPVNVKNTNPRLAGVIISQYGGPYPITLQSHTKHKGSDTYMSEPLYNVLNYPSFKLIRKL